MQIFPLNSVAKARIYVIWIWIKKKKTKMKKYDGWYYWLIISHTKRKEQTTSKREFKFSDE